MVQRKYLLYVHISSAQARKTTTLTLTLLASPIIFSGYKHASLTKGYIHHNMLPGLSFRNCSESGEGMSEYEGGMSEYEGGGGDE